MAAKALLIDGTALTYRAFYGMPHLGTSSGQPTNAVYGFAMMLHSLLEKEQPAYVGVAFDAGRKTFRHAEFAAYKEQRKPTPDGLTSQLPLVKRLLAAYRIPVFEQEGYEAEDLLATIARQVRSDGVEIWLVSGDKDVLQLVNSHVKVFNPHAKAQPLMDAQAVRQHWGIGPEQVVDLLALMGDSVDNIPGVPGVGEKTAVQLLQRFGSVAELYRRVEELDSPARRQALLAHRDQVELARRIATVTDQAPVSAVLADLALNEPDWPALKGLLREFEFKKLLRDVEAKAPAQAGTSSLQLILVGERLPEDLVASMAGPMAVGVWPGEAAGLSVLLVLSQGGSQAWAARLTPEILASPAGGALAQWLSDPGTGKIVHDGKSAIRRLGALGVPLRGLAGDTMIAAYLLHAGRAGHTVQDLAQEYFQQSLPGLPAADAGLRSPAGKAPGSGKPGSTGAAACLPVGVTPCTPPAADLFGGQSMEGRGATAGLDAAGVLNAFGEHVAVLVRLHARLAEQLAADGMRKLYDDIELPLVSVLARMEQDGIAVDVSHLASLKAAMDGKLAGLVHEVEQLAGTAFNLNSPKQLAEVLFERLQLPVVKRTKTGPSTDSEVLRQLAAKHPLPAKLIEYRELSKLVSTYVEALPALVNPATQRLHTSFNQAATATGRLSSSEPNLQNIPVKTELGRSIRKAFVAAGEDGTFVAADYSQIELRILAHVSDDPNLREAFRQGRDIHRFTAALVYGLPEDQVQPEQRSAMKAVNFGVLYGMSAYGLSRELGVPQEEAQAFIDAYFQRYPKVRGYLDGQIAQAKRDGFVRTMFGRRRYIPELKHPEPAVRQLGERMAINAPIQGTAADLIKLAMVQLQEALASRALKSRMLLQVHDELIFEAPGAEVPVLTPLIREIMQGAISLTVPLVVTVKIGPNWLDLKSVPA